MRISDWSSDVCSSDLGVRRRKERRGLAPSKLNLGQPKLNEGRQRRSASAQGESGKRGSSTHHPNGPERRKKETRDEEDADPLPRSEEHTSELQSLMRISYAVFCLKKKKTSNRYQLKTTSRNPQRQQHK